MRPMRFKRHPYGAAILVAVLLGASAVQADAQASDSSSSQRPDSVVQALVPGDAIRLFFWRERDYNRDYPVDETGRVILPFLGTRRVTGVHPVQLKRRLLEEYSLELRNQDVEITLLRRVRVLGQVNQPGLYHVDPTMTLGDAVALAGGALPGGKLNGIQIMRNGAEIRSNLEAGTLVVEQIRSGDQIMVPRRSWIARNTRLVVGALLSATAFVVVRAAF